MRADPLIKPYLKWAGGKRQLLPEIQKHLPDNFDKLRYYEPFIGAGALFFTNQPRRAVISDSNEELILTYRAIQEHIDELIEALEAHEARNSEEYYYQIREQDRNREAYAQFSDVYKAARLMYLNKTLL